MLYKRNACGVPVRANFGKIDQDDRLMNLKRKVNLLEEKNSFELWVETILINAPDPFALGF